MSGRKHTFWCRWEAPDTIPDEHMVAEWPRGMKGWVSGHTAVGDYDGPLADCPTHGDFHRVLG